MVPRWTIASRTLSGVLLAARLAAADPPSADPVAAEALFREAKRLMAAQNYAEACPKLAESHRLDPGGGTLLNLAICHELEGKSATSWSEFQEAIRIGRDGRQDRVRIAQEHIAALEPKLARLTLIIAPDSSVRGLELFVDDAPRKAPTWGTPIPIDPGVHSIVAQAPGRRRWQASRTIGHGEQIRLEVPRLDATPSPKGAVAVASATPEQAPGRSESREASPAAPEATERTGWRAAGYVAIGIGVAAAGVGSYFGLAALSKSKESDRNCPDGYCDDHAVELNRDAQKAATLSTIGFGACLLSVGIGTYLVASTKTSSRSLGARLTLAPIVTGDRIGGVVGSSF